MGISVECDHYVFNPHQNQNQNISDRAQREVRTTN